MRLPRITIEYQDDDSFAVGKFSSTLALGFGFHFAWIFLALYSTDEVYSLPTSGTGFEIRFFTLIFYSATLLCYVIFSQAARKLFFSSEQRHRNRLIVAVMTCAGSLLIFISDTSTPLGMTFLVLSSIFMGIGSAALLMSFGVSFSVCDIATITIETALTFIIAPVVYAVIAIWSTYVPYLGGILTAALPMLELVCLNLCSYRLVDQLEFGSATIPIHKAPFMARIGIPCFLLGLGICYLRTESLEWMWSIKVHETLALVLFLSCVIASFCFIVVMLSERQSFNFMIRTLLPLVAIALTVVAMLELQSIPIGIGIIFGSYILVEGGIWIYCSDISQRYRISAFQAFGAGRGCLALGPLIAMILGSDTSPMAELFNEQMPLTILILAFFVIALAILPTQKEVLNTLKNGHFRTVIMNIDGLAEIEKADENDITKQYDVEEYSVQMPRLSNESVSPESDKNDEDISGNAETVPESSVAYTPKPSEKKQEARLTTPQSKDRAAPT
ncbi:MAG: hypothetical protein LUB61_00005, partial [Eggerthellaceae bacterium]|nr:hypothetical protein [Eggerthellaceae bacterium]